MAAGLTPAWQQIVVLDAFRVGQVNRAREVRWCASGKVLNVALALHHLGESGVALAPRGGATGESMAVELEGLGLGCRWIPVERPTRVCTTVLDAGGGSTTELVENASPLAEEEVVAFVAGYEELARDAEVIVLSGSLAPGAPSSLYRELVRRARGRVVLDGRGPELLEALSEGPFLVKPNRGELGATLGRRLDGADELGDAMEAVRRAGAEWVAVSQGRGALWLRGPDGFFRFEPARVATVNPIGCGDTLAAGIAWGLREGVPVPEAVRLGMGAAALNASVLLPGRVEAATARRLAADVRIEPA